MALKIDYNLVVTTISILIALWQFWSRKKLKGFIRLEAMELYRNTGILLGAAQHCLEEIKSNNMDLANADAGKIEGMAQALFQRSVKNIHHHFNYSEKTVDRWVRNKKIDSHHKDDFLKYTVKQQATNDHNKLGSEMGIDEALRILELEGGESPEQIRRAFRKMAMRYHPDRCPNFGKKVWATKRFIKAKNAHDFLMTQRTFGKMRDDFHFEDETSNEQNSTEQADSDEDFTTTKSLFEWVVGQTAKRKYFLGIYHIDTYWNAIYDRLGSLVGLSLKCCKVSLRNQVGNLIPTVIQKKDGLRSQ